MVYSALKCGKFGNGRNAMDIQMEWVIFRQNNEIFIISQKYNSIIPQDFLHTHEFLSHQHMLEKLH